MTIKVDETKIVKKPEDTFKPDATVTDKIKPKIIINDELVSDNPEFVLKGSVIDKGGSKNVYLFIQTANEKRQRVNLNNGKFEISRFSLDDQEYTLTAIDGSNNKFSKKVDVGALSKSYHEFLDSIKDVLGNESEITSQISSYDEGVAISQAYYELYHNVGDVELLRSSSERMEEIQSSKMFKNDGVAVTVKNAFEKSKWLNDSELKVKNDAGERLHPRAQQRKPEGAKRRRHESV